MSTVVILVDGVDITNDCLFSQTSFESQFGGVAGTFQIVVRDPERNLTFVTGVEMSCDIDGIRLFGGYVTQVAMGHMAPAADTSDLENYQLRTWTLRGADYNIIFDKRVFRDTTDYLSVIETAGPTDGEVLRELVDVYSDCADFDTSGILDIVSLPGGTGDATQQGSKLRDKFQNLSFFGGAIWYINGDKTFIYMPYENVEKRWGFSDQPNNNGITASPDEYQGSTARFREVEAQEDGTYIVNDALIWGGSPFAGTAGGTVFAREENTTSQSTYGRWQVSETHFGEPHYKIQDGVDARASVIVNGPPGTDIYGEQKGLRYSQWQFTFTWFSTDVPLLSGTPDHLVAGDIVTIEMNVFDVTKLLPLRSLRITFPDALNDDADPDDRVVQFDGTFGLQVGDPFTLWRYILQNQTRVNTMNTAIPNAVNDDSTQTTYGAWGQLTPTPATDSSTTLFTLAFGYIPGTLSVYIDGLLKTPITDFAETDPIAGTFTMTTAPTTGSVLLCSVLTLDE